MAKRATRHNGRAGKHGVYNPKHNDREFDVTQSEHIDLELYKHDILWNCYHGFYTVADKDNDPKKSFTEVEKAYYFDHYFDHVDAQNKRNEKAGHSERNRSTNDLLSNPKTCPEETLLQIGNIENQISLDLFLQISNEYLSEFEKRFGEHVHIIDWALHLDEATPHIHERHVFDCKDAYGHVTPMQDKALEALGIPLPNPDAKRDKFNNRKQMFDSICRTLFIDIAKKYGVEMEEEPIYGGREYLEKQEYILAKQSEKIKNNDTVLMTQEEKMQEYQLKFSDAEALLDDMAAVAYDKACEVVANEAGIEAHNQDVEEIENMKKWILAPERKASPEIRNYAASRFGELQQRIMNNISNLINRVREKLQEPKTKEKNLRVVKEKARESLLEKLSQYKNKSTQDDDVKKQENKKLKKQNMEL